MRPICLTTFALLLVADFGPAREAAPFRAGLQDGVKKPSAAPDDRKKLVEDVKADLSKAVGELQRDNPGAEARAAQKRILDNIDKLLEADDDPPPSANDAQPPMTPPPNPKPEPKAAAPMPDGANPDSRPVQPKQITQPEGNKGPRDGNPGTAAEMLNELAKKGGQWGHRPPGLPPEMDAHLRQRFPPRYEDLLREYYRSVAESQRRD